MSRCIFCGYCEVACPFDAITMGHDYELSDYSRSDLIFTKEMLLAEPLERTLRQLRNEGELMRRTTCVTLALLAPDRAVARRASRSRSTARGRRRG